MVLDEGWPGQVCIPRHPLKWFKIYESKFELRVLVKPLPPGGIRNLWPEITDSVWQRWSGTGYLMSRQAGTGTGAALHGFIQHLCLVQRASAVTRGPGDQICATAPVLEHCKVSLRGPVKLKSIHCSHCSYFTSSELLPHGDKRPSLQSLSPACPMLV